MPDWTSIFNANVDPADPTSQNALALRQRVALAMMSGQGRKGYPKNLGEGLSAIGDALGDVGMARRMYGQQDAFEAATKAAQSAREGVAPVPTVEGGAGPRAEAATSPRVLAFDDSSDATNNAPPVQTADASYFPDPSTAQASIPASMAPQLGQNTGAPPVGPLPQSAGLAAGPANPVQASQLGALLGRPDADAAAPAAPVASADPNAAPVAPGNPAVRAAAARIIANRTGGPPPNPMLAAGSVPSQISAIPSPLEAAGAGSPVSAAGNRPITMSDMPPIDPTMTPGVQLAQARPRPQPEVYVGQTPSLQTTQPQPAPLPALTPGAPAPGPAKAATDRPVLPARPDPLPVDPRQREDERLRSQAESTGNAALKDFYANRVGQWEALRKANDDRRVREWEMNLQAKQADMQAWNARQRDLNRINAETSKAQSEASIAADKATISSRAGGVDPEVVVKDFQARQTAAKSNVDMLKQAKIAMEALNNGIVSGVGANMRIDMERLKAWAFNNKSANDLATNSQIFQSAIANTLGGAVRAIQPSGGPTSENDMKIATGIVGASPQLQEEAKRRIVGNFIEKLHGDINDYEDKKNKIFGGLKADSYFDVKTDPVHEDPRYVQRLIEHSTEKAYRDKFDEKFGRGAAQLEIDRAARAKRYPRAE